nr:phospholipase SGR2-like isoform X1 [Tanacetum cinerariifolium]
MNRHTKMGFTSTECIGPKGSLSEISESDPVSYDLATTRNKLYSDEEERVGVPVKGGLYEVDLLRRHSFPVYWNGDNRRVLRGHCRVWHRRTFQPSGLFAARVDMQGSSPGLHAIFTGEDDTWDAWLNIPSSGFSGIVNLGGTGIKLRRGYAPSHSPKPTQDELRQQKEEEMDDYSSQVPVWHLVFMVHGIGQRLQKANLVDDVGTFRQLTQNLADLHLTSYQQERVLFIPCQ